MKERPILFSAPMVRAILEGRKTQTRRVAIKTSQPENVCPTDFDATEAKIEIENKHSCVRYWKQCPYGQPGDRLWVRETWCVHPKDEKVISNCAYLADGDFIGCAKWTPSIHMPRWASRILLEITAVRVERLNDISEDDALSEGVTFKNPVNPGHASRMGREAFAELWQSINGPESWDENPWVWAIEFKRVQP